MDALFIIFLPLVSIGLVMLLNRMGAISEENKRHIEEIRQLTISNQKLHEDVLDAMKKVESQLKEAAQLLQ